jgi:ubiquinone/menaquinone biosynthesis C-methylase UbiE
VTVPASVGLALIADDLVAVALGDKWAPVVPLLQVLSVCCLIRSLGVLLSPVLFAQYRTAFLFKWNASALVVMTFAFWGGAAWSGALGVALASVIVYPLLTVWMARAAFRELGIGWYTIWDELRPVVRAAVVMTGWMVLLEAVRVAEVGHPLARLAFMSVSGAVVYAVTIIWWGGRLTTELAEVASWVFLRAHSVPAADKRISAGGPAAGDGRYARCPHPDSSRGDSGGDLIRSAKAHVKDFFSERARAWADGYKAIEPRTLNTRNLMSRQRFALEMLEAGAPRASKVLDVGCGPGEMARELSRRGYEVWGVDIAEPMIRYARVHCGSGRFLAGDLEHLPFRDNTFDAVVCLGVVEYLDTTERSLREVWRVIRPGGKALISTASAISPLYHVDRVLISLMAAARPLYHFVKYQLRGRLAPVHQDLSVGFVHRRFYPWRWGRLLRSVGLETEEWVCHGWGWYRSWLGLLTELLSQKGELVRHILERSFGQVAVRRATNKFVRNRALNWVLSEQIVRVRAVKVMSTPLSPAPGPPVRSARLASGEARA